MEGGRHNNGNTASCDFFVCLFSATNTVLVLEDKNQVYGTEKAYNTELVNL